MKSLLTGLLLCAGLLCGAPVFAGSFWQQVDAGRAPQKLQAMHPSRFLVYTMDEASLKLLLWNLSENVNDAMILELPMPDGTLKSFKVWQTPMMPGTLAAKYPEIRTFTGEALGNRSITARLDFTTYGFHAMIFSGEQTSFIDPYDNYRDGFYMVHYKKDETRALADRMHCDMKGDNEPANNATPMVTEETGLPKLAHRAVNGYTLRTYRIGVSCSHQYAQAATGLATPTFAEVLAKMTTTMNRVNGVYNREFSVQMNFVANEDTLIWPTVTGSVNGYDPFDTINSNGAACLNRNQATVTSRIGTANFDCGHVFTTGGGGISSLGVVCNSSSKAKSVTGSPTPVGDGYDIDYVAHEMGHEFGSNHTFNDNTNGSCTSNAVSACAYEPGSGATIMDYAGICPPDDLQMHSDAYFSTSSLVQIQSKLAGSENACAVSTPSGNLPAGLDGPLAVTSYVIPYKTPFELMGAAAIDSASDTATTYEWAQMNLGDFGKRLSATYIKGPIFRSFNPAYTPARIFPKLSSVLAGTLTNVTAEGNMGEKAPDTARYLTFKMTVRTILNGNGCFVVPDDTVHINAVSTATYGGFKVTSQGTAGLSLPGGSTQTVTWDVVGTDAAPVSAATVDIYMSDDGGNTWAYNLGNFPNNGSADIVLPNPATASTSSRFKVKGTGNVFFNVNLKNFAVTYNATAAVTGHAGTLAGVSIYPVPATDVLHIAGGGRQVSVSIYNAIGQLMYTDTVQGAADIAVSAWARGIYYARVVDAMTGEQATRALSIK